jgi:MoxR-like ATPase
MSDVQSSVEELQRVLTRAKEEVTKVVIGQDDAIEKCLIAIFTNNHLLIEGPPGVAKTLLVRSLSQVMGVDTKRIQFTPDLMPADITGTNIYNMQTQEFFLAKGPLFTTFLLADEINRAPAKTQSALLQAMQERMVTIDRENHTLPEHFTVFATQNPIESEGTYPLPEAQKDRFMLKIEMACPSQQDEEELALRTLSSTPPEALLDAGVIEPILNPQLLSRMRHALNEITIKEELVQYAVSIVRDTRSDEGVLVGAGPRATQALLLSARAHAASAGRDFVTPDDIKSMAFFVLTHRIVLRPEFEIEGLSPREVVGSILKRVAVPH